MWILQLNLMRDRFERLDPVARSETRAGLDAFLSQEAVEPYSDEGTSGFHGGPQMFRKSFRKGGPLEWYNPPDRPECFVECSLEAWLEQTRLNWEKRVLTIPPV